LHSKHFYLLTGRIIEVPSTHGNPSVETPGQKGAFSDSEQGDLDCITDLDTEINLRSISGDDDSDISKGDRVQKKVIQSLLGFQSPYQKVGKASSSSQQSSSSSGSAAVETMSFSMYGQDPVTRYTDNPLSSSLLPPSPPLESSMGPDSFWKKDANYIAPICVQSLNPSLSSSIGSRSPVTSNEMFDEEEKYSNEFEVMEL
jgi:hypothetical protein